MADLRLPLPTLPEQRAIAAFLDREVGKIDDLVAEQRRLIALLAEKRQAVISTAVTRGLNPDAPMKPSGVDWIGDIPAGWEVTALKRFTLSRCDGPFGSGLKSDHYSDEGVRVIRLQNIRSQGFSDDDKAFLDVEYGRELLDGHGVAACDLLIAGLGDERNPVGRACVAPADIGSALVKADTFRFRLNREIVEPQFAAYQLNAGATTDAATLSTGTTRTRISLSAMESRLVAVPSLAEQRAIVDYLDAETARLDSLTATAQSAITLLLERRSALISAAVTGKIDVRDLAPPEAA